MEHSNPILMGNNSPQKFITIGEVMLRLTPPNYEKIRMAWIPPSSASCPTTLWAKALCAGCAATTYTARR